MASPKLRSPDQPWALQALFWVFEFCASLKLAVILIFSAAATLAWATFVESEYGTPAVQFGVYGSLWFEALNALLAVNIFCAAAIRFPWKRHQTGFVITHIGLLTLLLGCLLQRRDGIDAQMPVFEGDYGYRAYTDDHYFELKLIDANRSENDLADVIQVPFNPGPFNWEEYAPGPLHLSSYSQLFKPVGVEQTDDWDELSFLDRMPGYVAIGLKNVLRVTSGFAFHTVGRDRGLIYDRDGIQVEVLDYYADSFQEDVPLMKLQISVPPRAKMDAEGRMKDGKLTWTPVEMRGQNKVMAEFPFGLGDEAFVGGGQLSFRMTGSEAERKAFLHSRPQGKIGPAGQIVLYAKGKAYAVQVDELLTKKEAGESVPLGDSGLKVELVGQQENGNLGSRAGGSVELLAEEEPTVNPNPAVEIKIVGGKSPGRAILFARSPRINVQDYSNEVFGTFWFDYGELTAEQRMSGRAGSRIDFLQGDDQQLYYRNWNGKEILAVEAMPTDKSEVNAFKMPIAQLKMFVDEFIPSNSPSKMERPLPFNAKKTPTQKRPAAKLRMTVDGKSREFWLAGMPVEPFVRPPLAGEHTIAPGEKRAISIKMPPRDIFENVGFQIELLGFDRKLDPGTSQAAHYGSMLNLVEREPGLVNKPSEGKQPDKLRDNVAISMNAPIDFVDPKTSRTFRIFQESFGGPWGPNDPIYKQHAPKGTGREQFFMSVLTINYDPGRGLKLAGCLLIVAGIFTMFYMRAYFFVPAARKEATTSTAKKKRAELVA